MAIARPNHSDPPPSQASLPKDYELEPGSPLDRACLLQFMRRTYGELYPEQTFDHLAQTIDAYFSSATPLWWITGPKRDGEHTAGLVNRHRPKAVACLWMGTAIDQVSGDRHAHIFLLYVAPEHRRLGLGRTLMGQAEQWAQARGDRQISLQVFNHNAPALSLYESLGYQAQSVALVKHFPG